MQIRVTVRDTRLDIQCGEGTQMVKWLGDVALARYPSNGIELGTFVTTFILSCFYSNTAFLFLHVITLLFLFLSVSFSSRFLSFRFISFPHRSFYL